MKHLKPKARSVRLDEIVVDAKAQTRADGLDERHVEELAGCVGELPPMLAVEFGGRIHLADGFHRYAALRRAKKLRVDVDVITGTEDDWIEAFAGANHGQNAKPRRNEDKRAAAARVMELRPSWSNRRIAEAAKVSEPLVRQLRSNAVEPPAAEAGQVRLNAPDEPRMVEGMDGKLYPAMSPKSKAADEFGDDDADPAVPGRAAAPDEPGTTAAHHLPDAHELPDHDDADSRPATDRAVTPDVPTDEKGRPIPDHLLSVFEARTLFRSLARRVGALIREAEELAASPHGAAIQVQSMRLEMEKGEGWVRGGMPYVVCPSCDGTGRQGPKGCPTCQAQPMIAKPTETGRGWVCYDRYGQFANDPVLRQKCEKGPWTDTTPAAAA